MVRHLGSFVLSDRCHCRIVEVGARGSTNGSSSSGVSVSLSLSLFFSLEYIFICTFIFFLFLLLSPSDSLHGSLGLFGSPISGVRTPVMDLLQSWRSRFYMFISR